MNLKKFDDIGILHEFVIWINHYSEKKKKNTFNCWQTLLAVFLSILAFNCVPRISWATKTFGVFAKMPFHNLLTSQTLLPLKRLPSKLHLLHLQQTTLVLQSTHQLIQLQGAINLVRFNLHKFKYGSYNIDLRQISKNWRIHFWGWGQVID